MYCELNSTLELSSSHYKSAQLVGVSTRQRRNYRNLKTSANQFGWRQKCSADNHGTIMPSPFLSGKIYATLTFQLDHGTIMLMSPFFCQNQKLRNSRLLVSEKRAMPIHISTTSVENWEKQFCTELRTRVLKPRKGICVTLIQFCVSINKPSYIDSCREEAFVRTKILIMMMIK